MPAIGRGEMPLRFLLFSATSESHVIRPLSRPILAKGENAMIWVNPYNRVRFGKTESVCGHFRSLPNS